MTLAHLIIVAIMTGLTIIMMGVAIVAPVFLLFWIVSVLIRAAADQWRS